MPSACYPILGAAALALAPGCGSLGDEGESGASAADLVYQVDYEATAVAGLSEQSGAPGGLTTTHGQVRAGQYAGQALLRPGDEQFRSNRGYRSEWQSDFYAEAGSEYWYGVSVYLPEDWNQGVNDDFFDDRIIFQFHEGTGASPALSLHVRSDDQQFVVRRRTGDGFEYLWTGTFQSERWYDFTFHVRWSQDDDGFAQVFIDQRLLEEYRGPTLVDGELTYAKWGIYGQPTRLIIDEVRIAAGRVGGLELVAPGPLDASTSR